MLQMIQIKQNIQTLQRIVYLHPDLSITSHFPPREAHPFMAGAHPIPSGPRLLPPPSTTVATVAGRQPDGNAYIRGLNRGIQRTGGLVWIWQQPPKLQAGGSNPLLFAILPSLLRQRPSVAARARRPCGRLAQRVRAGTACPVTDTPCPYRAHCVRHVLYGEPADWSAISV